MGSQPKNVETQLSVEQNKLIDLERQKSIIETEDHRGFGDAARLIQLRVKWRLSKEKSGATSNEPTTNMVDKIGNTDKAAKFSSERARLNGEITKGKILHAA
jgi:hypothetical protein